MRTIPTPKELGAVISNSTCGSAQTIGTSIDMTNDPSARDTKLLESYFQQQKSFNSLPHSLDCPQPFSDPVYTCNYVTLWKRKNCGDSKKISGYQRSKGMEG